METSEFDWLDVRPAQYTGLEQRGGIMRPGEQEGADRIWFTDGDCVWFRRAAANPATLERHNKFVKAGDYKHVETQDGVEIWKLQDSSVFKTKQIDLGELDFYNVTRQAAIAACKRQWQTFEDIVSYIRQRLFGQYHTQFAETMFAECYMRIMRMIEMRRGPGGEEINRELASLSQKRGDGKGRIITLGK